VHGNNAAVIYRFKAAYNSVRRGVCYSILRVCGISENMQADKMSVNEIVSRVCIDEHLSGDLPIGHGLKQ
jgi:hypothetical protein